MQNINNLYKYALVIAVIGWVLNFMVYLAGVKIMLEGSWFITIVLGALTIYGTLRLRDENGGYFTFGEVFKTVFIIGAIYGLGEAIFSFILYKWIDPQLYTKVQEYLLFTIENMQEQSQSAEQAEMFDKLKGYFGEIKAENSLGELFGNILTKGVKYGFYALVLGGFLKKRNPDPFA